MELNVTSDEDLILVDEKQPKRHISELTDEERAYLKKQLETQFKTQGLRRKTSRVRGRSRSSSRAPKKVVKLSNFMTQCPLNNTDVQVLIPYWLEKTVQFISQEENIKLQGIFRKEGAFKRKNEIVTRFKESGTTKLGDNESPHDITSALKQLLRDMPEPLIPIDDHSLLIKCLTTTFENVMSMICLLPVPNINALTYLMQFLHKVAERSDDNQMGASNLAKVFTPNIMPPPETSVKKYGKDMLDADKKLIDSHIKVVEILIENGDTVGFLTPKLEKILSERAANFTFSEDELEENGKRRNRSGSVTRMMDIIKKKVGLNTNKVTDTPVQTPNFSLLHTPIINGSTKRRNKEKLNALANTTGDCTGENSKVPSKFPPRSQTPDFFFDFSSPACLDPSPALKTEWKTPMSKVKKFDLRSLTPSILKNRNKTAAQAFSAPGKNSSKIKVFGRKAGKKQVLLMQQIQDTLKKQPSTKSLIKSPKGKALSSSNSNTRIPRPPESRSSTYSLRREASSNSIRAPPDQMNISAGEYVTFFPKKKRSSVVEATSPWEVVLEGEREVKTLAPLIKEIDDLTLNAVGENFSPPPRPPPPLPPRRDLSSSQSFKGPRKSISPKKRMRSSTTGLEKVENEFNRAIKETKIIQLRSELITRRHSTRERTGGSLGLSPCQRKLRRRSHEISSNFKISPISPSKIVKNNTRICITPLDLPCAFSPFGKCTLRRGRPNSIRSGLARPVPSPIVPFPPSNNPATGDQENLPNPIHLAFKDSPQLEQKPIQHQPEENPTRTLRRKSSVQELVQKLELKKPEVQSNQELGPDVVQEVAIEVKKKSPPASELCFIAPTPVAKKVSSKSAVKQIKMNDLESEFETNWVPASKFDFSKHLRGNLLGKGSGGLRSNERPNRDSIQVIKSLNAGKVSANVKLFDSLNRKSPRSQIPRFVGAQSRNVTASAEKPKPSKVDFEGAQSKMMRRFSSVDVQRGRNEMLLDGLKREGAKIKRSSTIGTPDRKNPINNQDLASRNNRRSIYLKGGVPNEREAVSLRRESSLAPFPKPPRGMKKARPHLATSPVASIQEDQEEEKFYTPALPTPKLISSRRDTQNFPKYNNRMLNATSRSSPVKRSVSERATSSTTPTVYNTPKIKKHLTIGYCDQFKNSPAKTPRRYPLRSCQDNYESPKVSKTPMKAIHFEHIDRTPRN